MWNTLYYGNEYPSRTRRVAINALIVCVLMGLFGMMADFVPSRPWSRIGLGVSLVVACVLSFWICRGYMSGEIPYGPGTTKYHRGAALCLVPIVVFGFTWNVVVRAVPDLLTRWNESSEIGTLVLKKRQGHSRRTCDYKVTGEYFGFLPGHVCVSPQIFNQLPEEGPMTLHGSSSIFGTHIHAISPAGADTRRDAGV